MKHLTKTIAGAALLGAAMNSAQASTEWLKGAHEQKLQEHVCYTQGISEEVIKDFEKKFNSPFTPSTIDEHFKLEVYDCTNTKVGSVGFTNGISDAINSYGVGSTAVSYTNDEGKTFISARSKKDFSLNCQLGAKTPKPNLESKIMCVDKDALKQPVQETHWKMGVEHLNNSDYGSIDFGVLSAPINNTWSVYAKVPISQDFRDISTTQEIERETINQGIITQERVDYLTTDKSFEIGAELGVQGDYKLGNSPFSLFARLGATKYTDLNNLQGTATMTYFDNAGNLIDTITIEGEKTSAHEDKTAGSVSAGLNYDITKHLGAYAIVNKVEDNTFSGVGLNYKF